jgi:hypothetical protein
MTLALQDLSARIERQGNYFAAGVALEHDLGTSATKISLLNGAASSGAWPVPWTMSLGPEA